MATVVYTRERLTFALDAFQDVLEAQRKRRERELEGPKYNFRRPAANTKAPLVLPSLIALRHLHDNDGEDEEYNPNSPRPVIRGISKASRQKRDEEKAKKVEKAERLGMTLEEVLKEDFGLGAFITLKVPSRVGKAFLKDMVIRHGETYLVVKDKAMQGYQNNGIDSDEKYVGHSTYEDQYMAGVGVLDVEPGRKLRNGRVLPRKTEKNKRCNECTKAGRRCQYKKAEECRYCVRNGLFCIENEEVVSERHNEQDDDSSPELATSPDTPPASQHLTNTKTTKSTQFQDTTATDTILFPNPKPQPLSATTRALFSSQPAPRTTQPSSHSPPSSDEEIIAGTVKTITTQFAHPIDFRYMPTPTYPTCDFCHDFRWPMRGLGAPRSVEVISYTDNGEYIEASNGFCGQGMPATKMCIRCALTRLHICRCEHSSIGPGERTAKKFDFGLYTRQISYKVPERVLKVGVHPMCSMCPFPAMYECLTRQTHDWARKPVPTDKVVKGCGLVLCQFCYNAVMGECGGKVSKWEIRETGRLGQVKVRADMVFLFPEDEENLLWKNYHFQAARGVKRPRQQDGTQSGGKRMRMD